MLENTSSLTYSAHPPTFDTAKPLFPTGAGPAHKQVRNPGVLRCCVCEVSGFNPFFPKDFAVVWKINDTHTEKTTPLVKEHTRSRPKTLARNSQQCPGVSCFSCLTAIGLSMRCGWMDCGELC